LSPRFREIMPNDRNVALLHGLGGLLRDDLAKGGRISPVLLREVIEHARRENADDLLRPFPRMAASKPATVFSEGRRFRTRDVTGLGRSRRRRREPATISSTFAGR
jgi:hypothetical protein